MDLTEAGREPEHVNANTIETTRIQELAKMRMLNRSARENEQSSTPTKPF